MKTTIFITIIAAIFAASVAIACPLPVDVKIQKVATNKSDLSPTIGATLVTRLRSQLREAFSCRDKQPGKATGGENIVNIDLVEIIHEGITATRVNIATDRGFFSARAIGGLYSGPSPQEQFEEAMKWIAKDISEAVCK